MNISFRPLQTFQRLHIRLLVSPDNIEVENITLKSDVVEGQL